MKILKYILVFGLPALVCGAGWSIGISIWGLIDNGRLGFDPKYLLIGLACTLPALASGLLLRHRWMESKTVWSDIGWAALHALIGAFLFGGMVLGLGGTYGYDFSKIVGGLVIGAIAGLAYGVILLPIQIIPAYLHIRLYRHLYHRFALAPKEQPNVATGEGPNRAATRG